MAERLQGGRVVARAIAAEGVDVVFAQAGADILPLLEGCRLEGIRVVDVRHVHSAGHAADAWGRLRRTCGVAILSGGHGVAGAVGAVATAYAAQTPLLVLGGGRAVADAEAREPRAVDQRALLAPVTKWSGTCSAPQRLAEQVATAVRHALAPPRGPVFLELPSDVVAAEATAAPKPASARTRARAGGETAAIERAGVLLSDALRPVVIAGPGVWWDSAADALDSLSSHGEIPVFLVDGARGSLPPGHPLLFRRALAAALAEADVVAVVGASLEGALGAAVGVPPTLVHVEGDVRELGRDRVPDVALTGDTRLVLQALWPLVRARTERQAWLETLRAAEDDGVAEAPAPGPKRPDLGLLVAELDRVLGPDAIVVCDGEEALRRGVAAVRVRRPGYALDGGALGALGFGPGFALGAGLAEQRAPVAVVTSDESFGLSGLDYDALVRHDVPAVVVIANDGGWAGLRELQVAAYGEAAEISTVLATSRYDWLTEIFGGHAEHVERGDELGPALERAFGSGGPAIVNVLLADGPRPAD